MSVRDITCHYYLFQPGNSACENYFKFQENYFTLKDFYEHISQNILPAQHAKKKFLIYTANNTYQLNSPSYFESLCRNDVIHIYIQILDEPGEFVMPNFQDYQLGSITFHILDKLKVSKEGIYDPREILHRLPNHTKNFVLCHQKRYLQGKETLLAAIKKFSYTNVIQVDLLKETQYAIGYLTLNQMHLSQNYIEHDHRKVYETTDYSNCSTCNEKLTSLPFTCMYCPNYRLCDKCENIHVSENSHDLSEEFRQRINEKKQKPKKSTEKPKETLSFTRQLINDAFSSSGTINATPITKNNDSNVSKQKNCSSSDHNLVSLEIYPELNDCFKKVCDNCNRPIVGVPFSCITCFDYQICDYCEEHNVSLEFHNESHQFCKDPNANLLRAEKNTKHEKREESKEEVIHSQHKCNCNVCQEKIIELEHSLKETKLLLQQVTEILKANHLYP